MTSLNDVVKACVASINSHEVELQLEENMPQSYSFDNKQILCRAIDSLVGEVEKHGDCDKIRFKTSLNGDVQVFELAWNGNTLAEEEIQKINSRYKIGVGLDIEPEARGTLMVGYFLGRLGFSVRIDNYSDGEYNVRNVVESLARF